MTGGPTLAERVRRSLTGPCGVRRGATLLLGCSGGADSMALLDLLAALAPELRLDLHAATVDHGLRDVEREVATVRDACAARGVPWALLRVEIDRETRAARGIEAAARRARHRALLERADLLGATSIALAHHLEDQAETVLMRAMVGTGVRGLAAMRPRRGPLVRPLLGIRPQELRRHLERAGCTWCEDPTNADPRFLRNRVRHELLPLMRSIAGGAVAERLAGLADRCAAEDRVIQERADAAASRAETPDGALAVAALAVEPLAVRARVVADLARRRMPEDGRLRGVHVESVLHLLEGPDRRAGVDLPGGVRVERRGAVLRALPRRGAHRDPDATPAVIDLAVPGLTRWPALGMAIRARVHGRREDVGRGGDAGVRRAWFDLDRLTRPLRVQSFAAGARIRPYGGPGSRKVSDVLGEARVPRERRAAWPMVMDADQVIWVPGGRAADVAPVHRGTTRILDLMLEESR